MNTKTLLSPKTLRLSLYSGITLIVVSMLFLGRSVETSPFLIQIGLAAITPAVFYATGVLVYRRLNAPLAAPGIIATGAWLVVIELIHFYIRRVQLPDFARKDYWLLASLLAAAIVTLTAYRARIWLLVPLVPLTQINATWAVLSAAGLGIAWWSVLSFLLVLAWWELPMHDQEWQRVYRVSSVLFEIFLLIFSYWLPAQTSHSMLITWGACALLVAILALRHGWVTLGPLAIVLLVCAVAWGLPFVWWPPVWLLIGIGTVIFIERLARRDPDQNRLALELSTALAVALSGLAALLAKGMPFFGTAMSPLWIVLSLAASGSLMIWIGERRTLGTAAHAGLWLLAAAWAETYFDLFDNSRAYGLWLSLLAVSGLLAERLLLSLNSTKRKITYSVREVVYGWPLADLVIGLSVIIVIWTGITTLDLPATDPMIVAATLAVVIGVWLVAGLLYRMPVLLYVALGCAPLPYALLLMLTVPPLRSLPFLGVAWQLLAISYLLVGHMLSRYRPAMLIPFFIAGYGLLGFGLTLTLSHPMLLIAALTLVVLVCFLTALAVISGEHPAWDRVIAQLVPPERRPYAYKHIHNTFVFLTAWLLAIWMFLMLGAASFTPARQGIILVLMSSAWIVLGRLLPRLPGVVGWPVYAAGWFMWLAGLLLVFFAPPEAIVTAIFGLGLSAEVLYRSKTIHWMPVFILQILFSVLQVAWMLNLPGYTLLLAVTMGLCLAGMAYDRRSPQAGRITAFTGGVLSLGIWIIHVNPVSTLGLGLLALVALLCYRRWEFSLAIYGSVIVVALMSGILAHWRLLLIAGGLQWVLGAILAARLDPRHFRSFTTLVFEECDHARLFLWMGSLCAAAGFTQGLLHANHLAELAGPTAALAAAAACCTFWLHVPRLPLIPLALGGGIWISYLMTLANLPYPQARTPIAASAVEMALVALGLQVFGIEAVRRARLFSHWRGLVWWIRPLLLTSRILFITSFWVMIVSLAYIPNPVWFVTTCLLLSAASFLNFSKDRRLRWAVTALNLDGLAWCYLLRQWGASGYQWYTASFGILVLTLVRIAKPTSSELIEYAAIGLMAYGGAVDISTHGAWSLAAAGTALQIVGLLLYGYLAQRKVPFLSALELLLAGLIGLIFMINPWLIPLAAGLLLLSGAVVLEVERERLERWLSRWPQWLMLPRGKS